MVPGLDSDSTYVGVVRLLGGGLAGITAASVTYPLDVVRTRLAAQVMPCVTTLPTYINLISSFGFLFIIFCTVLLYGPVFYNPAFSFLKIIEQCDI
jgi:hypothetical protein